MSYSKKRLVLIVSLLLISSSITAAFFPNIAKSLDNNENNTQKSVPHTESFARTAVQEAIKAHGGTENLKKLDDTGVMAKAKVLTTSGLSGGNNDFECMMISQGERLRLEVNLIGQKYIIGYDGSKSWSQFGDWVSPTTPSMTKRILEEIHHGLNMLLDIDKTGTKVESLADKTINGKRCTVVKIIPTDGTEPGIFYFDQNTKLLERSEYMGIDEEQGIPAMKSTDYNDYRPVSGVLTAFKTIELVNGKKHAESHVLEMKIDYPVTDKLFAMPPQSEVSAVANGNSLTIPFDYVNNMIMVRARLNRGREYKFILDTGASQTVLDSAIAKTLGFYGQSSSSSSDKPVFSITAGGKSVPLNYMTIETVSLGDVNLDNIPALVMDMSALAKVAQERPAGLIGANILRRFLVSIDYRNRKIVLSDPNNVTVDPGSIVIPTVPVYGATALIVNATLDGKEKMNFLVDTGAAFNNLPMSAAKSIVNFPSLAIGQLVGLDGQPMSIGAVKIKTLQIGSTTINNPVFAVQPGGNESATSGLFTASSMGILGNPIWSKYDMTVDYRNERLILKKSIESNLVDSFMSMINEAEIQYHNDNDTQKATQTFQGIAKLAESKKIYSAQAIALAMTARCFSHKYAETKQDTFFDQATQLYNEASLKASESHSKDIQAQVFALWAELYFLNPKKPDNILNGQNLINQAISRAPAEPVIYCVLGPMLLNLGQTGAASKVLDQALMLDPSSWDALWAKYKLAKLASNQTAMKNIQAQLKYYYPDSPEVDALSQPNSQAGSSPAQVAPQTTTTPKPIAKPAIKTTTSKPTSAQKPTVKPKPAAKKSVPAKPAAKKK